MFEFFGDLDAKDYLERYLTRKYFQSFYEEQKLYRRFYYEKQMELILEGLWGSGDR